jgi:hypothetical protein
VWSSSKERARKASPTSVRSGVSLSVHTVLSNYKIGQLRDDANLPLSYFARQPKALFPD